LFYASKFIKILTLDYMSKDDCELSANFELSANYEFSANFEFSVD